MKETIGRAAVTLLVFAGIWLLSGPIIGAPAYDMYVKSVEFLAAVTGAGCYWVGSARR